MKKLKRLIFLPAVADGLRPVLRHCFRLFHELKSGRDEMAVVEEVARIITATLDIEQVYERFALEMKKIVGFDLISINVVDHEAGMLVRKYDFGKPMPAPFRSDIWPLHGSHTQHVVETGKTLIRANIAAHRRFTGDQDFLEVGLNSSIRTPLISKGRAIGTIGLFSKGTGAFGGRAQRVLERLASQIAPAVENATLYDETERTREQQRRLAQEDRALAEIGRIISSSLVIDDVYDRVAEEVRKLVPFDRMDVGVIDQDRGIVSPTWISGTDVPDRRRGTEVPLAGTLAEVALQGRSPIMLEADSESDLRHRFPRVLPDFRSGMRSFLAVPLINRNIVIGVLQIRSKQHGIYSQRHLDLAERVGNQIAGAIANAQLYEKTRQAEEAVQESEELYRTLVDNSVLGMGLYRPGETLIFSNQRLTQIVGYTKEECESPEFNIMDLFLAEDQGLIADNIRRRLAGEHIPPYEVRLVTKDKTVKWLEIHNVFVRYRGRGAMQVQLLDVTERKQAEERVKETAHLASIGELAAGVAHEINNPLTSVLGYSDIVLRSKLPKKYREDLQTIYDQAKRAAKIVQNLVFFARRSGIDKQYLDVNSILSRALEMKSYDFKVNNIRVTTLLSPELRKTMADEHQLVQVILNLLTNAEQAICRARGKGHIDICTASLEDGIQITIRDDGPGIQPEHLQKIFEPFFTTKEVGQGTGLGLSISYGIVKSHGGEIWGESVEGQGATFHITLPVVLPEVITIPQIPRPESNGGSTKHLLVVDDEPNIRDLLRKYLELERYTVDLAEDGNEAWRKLRSMPYDCILLDMKMPEMSGPELYELLRDFRPSLANKVVFITGDTANPASLDFISDTGNFFITKPFRLEDLLERVNDLWERLSSDQVTGDVQSVPLRL